jgi:hypothetical protein
MTRQAFLWDVGPHARSTPIRRTVPTAAVEATIRRRRAHLQEYSTMTSSVSPYGLRIVTSESHLGDLEGMCPNAYAYAYDESSNTALWTCDSGLAADFALTFCPPYVPSKRNFSIRLTLT